MKKLRAIRVEDSLWSKAIEKAHKSGTTISQVIRESLKKYNES